MKLDRRFREIFHLYRLICQSDGAQPPRAGEWERDELDPPNGLGLRAGGLTSGLHCGRRLQTSGTGLNPVKPPLHV